MNVLPVTEKERRHEGKRSIGPRMKYGHANLMTSLDSHFAGGLSKKSTSIILSVTGERYKKLLFGLLTVIKKFSSLTDNRSACSTKQQLLEGNFSPILSKTFCPIKT